MKRRSARFHLQQNQKYNLFSRDEIDCVHESSGAKIQLLFNNRRID